MAATNVVGDAMDDKTAHVSPPGWIAPRLSTALLNAKVGMFANFKTQFEMTNEGKKEGKKIALQDKGTFDAELNDLLQHILERLKGGVLEAWMSPYGYGYVVPGATAESGATPAQLEQAVLADLEKNLLNAAYWITPEETWARAFSELFVFSSYADPSLIYHNDGLDIGFYEAFPAVYPVTVACQQLATYCALSRGFTPADVGGAGFGCNADTVYLPAFEHRPDLVSAPLVGNPLDDASIRQTNAPSFAAGEAFAKLPLTPGSVFAFNPGGSGVHVQNLGKYTHIGSVLRVSGALRQFIDTGVLAGDYPGNEHTGEGGTVDHEFSSKIISAAAGNCVGVGILKKPIDLEAATAKLKSARPLGFVRLAVIDTTAANERVRFVSKLLHMRHPVSWFIWSLRGLPTDGLRVVWMIYAVVGKAASAKLMGADGLKTAPAKCFTRGEDVLLLANVVRSELDGRVTVARHKLDKGKDGYIEGFAIPNDPPALSPQMGQGCRLGIAGAPSLGNWATQLATFDKRFIHRHGESTGVVDEGVTDAEVAGVKFFEPSSPPPEAQTEFTADQIC